MDKAILIPSVSIAFLFILIYLYRCHKTNNKVDTSIVISAVLHSSGIICGLLLILSPFSPEIKLILSGIDIYIVIGGISVLFVSSQALHKDVIKSTQNIREE